MNWRATAYFSLIFLLLSAVAFAQGAPTAPGAPVSDNTGGENAEVHARTGIKAPAPSAQLPALDSDPQRDAELDAIAGHLSCACYNSGDWRIDASKTLRKADCSCAEAETIRTDLAQATAGLSLAQLHNKRALAETLEKEFATRRAEYERLFRYPTEQYDWFINNVRCVCDGCKPTIFFSKCQLGCTPSVIYKLRARIFMAFGFTRDELLDYYRDEYNASHSAREQITREWLLPGRQKEHGWLVPALGIALALLVLVATALSWVRAGRKRAESKAFSAAEVAAGPSPSAASQAQSLAARKRVRAELEDDEVQW